MPKNYNLYTPARATTSAGIDTRQIQINNVLNALAQIETTGNFLAAHDNGQFPGDRYADGANHFQGLQRLRDSNYMVVSGSDEKSGQGNLFLLKMASRTTDSAWRTNTHIGNSPPDSDKVIFSMNVTDQRHGLSKEFWHVGGISSLGDIVAAPVESPNDGSVIIFYDFSNPEKPKLFKNAAWISRPHSKAGAVGMCKLPNGKFLVLTLGKHLDGILFLDSYVSNDRNIESGFTRTGSFRAGAAEFPDCQGIDILIEKGGQYYIAATQNTRITSPFVNGDDQVQLFRFELDAQTNSIGRLQRLRTFVFKCRVKGQSKSIGSHFYATFNAGASVYVHSADTLFLYSCFHHRKKEAIRFEEFHPRPDKFTPETIRNTDKAWVDMYEDSDYGGARLSLVGADDIKIADYSQLVVQARGINKTVSSLRCQIPAGKTLRLYRRKNFESKNNDHLEIAGTGKMKVINELGRLGFDNKTGSSEIV